MIENLPLITEAPLIAGQHLGQKNSCANVCAVYFQAARVDKWT